MIEVIRLHNHIVKLQEGQALFHALLVALSSQHIVHGETGTYVPQQVDIVQLQEPVGIVDHNGFPFSKINETLHLLFKAVAVMLDRFWSHHRAHVRSTRWVANVTGAASH